MTAPVFPPGRYGRRREPRRARPGVLWSLVALTVLVGLAVTATLYRTYVVGQVQGTVLAFDVVSDTTVRIRFSVRGADGDSARCTVRARGADGAEVGRAEVRVPPRDDGDPTLTYDLATHGRAVTGEVPRCAVGP